jgi:hypothetical protein
MGSVTYYEIKIKQYLEAKQDRKVHQRLIRYLSLTFIFFDNVRILFIDVMFALHCQKPKYSKTAETSVDVVFLMVSFLIIAQHE